MRCSKAIKLFSPSVDEELSEREQTSLETHLEGCRECSAKFGEIRNMHHMLAQAEKFKAPYGFSTRVMANLAEESPKKRLFVPFFTKFAEALVILAVITTGIVSGNFLFKTALAGNEQNIATFFSLDVFDASPRDSVGGAYLAMLEDGR
jgi:hypothetical protein